MRLLRLSEFQFEPDDFVCRERRLGRWIVGIVFLVLGLIFYWVSGTSEEVSRLALMVSLGCVLYVLSFAVGVIRGARTNPWVLCLRQSGVALNLRSYWNADRSPEDLVVAWLDWEEIRSAGECRVALRLPDPDNWRDRRFREAHLDLELSHCQTEELRTALAREFASDKSARVHYFAPTVLLKTQSRLRIGWKDKRHAMRPRLGILLERLTPYVPIRPIEASTIDWRTLGPSELDGLLHDLFKSGHHDQVVRLLRKARKWSRKQAEDFVEELTTSRVDS